MVLVQLLTGHGLSNPQDLLKETAPPISKPCRTMLNGKHNVNVSFDTACNFQAYQLTCSNFVWQNFTVSFQLPFFLSLLKLLVYKL